MNNIRDILPTKENLLDAKIRAKFQMVIVSFVFFVVGAVFTIINLIQKQNTMAIVTGIFSILSLSTCCLTIFFRKGNGFAEFLFVCSAIFMFTYFLVTGGARDGGTSIEGFSTYWLIILPFCSMMVLGLKKGTIASVFTLIIIVSCVWVAPDKLLTYTPTNTFHIRFPFVYIAAFAASFLFELSRYLTDKANDELKQKLHKAADVDYLTKLKNRNWLAHKIKKYQKNVGTVIRKMNCILVDIDEFKKINDTYGHLFGDEVLKSIANIMLKYDAGNAVRWGGDEFIIIDLNHDDKYLYEIGERIRKEAEEFYFEQFPDFHYTVSVGIASQAVDTDFQLNTIIELADAQSARAKKNGRNCVYMVSIDQLINN